MDKNFIKDNNLNEAVERFQQIASYKSPKQSLNEFTFVTNSMVDEDGEDNGDNQMNQQQGNNGMQQPQNAAPDVQNQMGDMNNQMGGQMPSDASQMPQNGDMTAQGDMQQQQMGDMPMDDGSQNADMGDLGVPEVGDDEVETEEMEPEDEVIDVDELTQSQEATEYKIDGVDDRLAKIYAVVKDFSDKLEQQQQSIISLKDEFEKRNPTPEERLDIRSQASYPYSEMPRDYWDKKMKENPHYNVIYDNNVPTSEEQDKFEIKKDDISGLNMKNISDTLNINQNLSDYLGF